MTTAGDQAELSSTSRREGPERAVAFIQQHVSGSGNTILGQGTIHHYTTVDKAALENHRNLSSVAAQVRNHWINSVLTQSIHGVLLELHKAERSDAIVAPFERAYVKPDGATERVPLGQSMLGLFQERGPSLLVLGDPGSGKTTSMLDLARSLLERADADREAPVPVVLNLSTWAAADDDLESWLLREMSLRYSCPPRLSAPWLGSGRLVLFLDGLDEVRAELRLRCVQAINRRADKLALAGLVVTCRRLQYAELAEPLRMNGAVEVLPLQPGQIDEFIANARVPPALGQAIRNDPAWTELAATPLMLSVIALAFHGERGDAIEVVGDSASLRNRIFAAYVERMIAVRGRAWPEALRASLRHALGQLALQMQRHAGTLFAPDLLQPSWFRDRKGRKRYAFLSRATLAFLCVASMLLGICYAGPQQELESMAKMINSAQPAALTPAGSVDWWAIHAAAVAMILGISAVMAGVVGWLGMALTMHSWDQRASRVPRWIYGTLLALSFGLYGGLPVLARSVSSASANDVRLLSTLQWSGQVMARRLIRWCKWALAVVAAVAPPLCLAAWWGERRIAERLQAATTITATLLGICVGTAACAALIFGGFTRAEVRVRKHLDDGIRVSLRATATVLGMTAALSAALLVLPEHSATSAFAPLVIGVGLNLAVVYGAFDVLAHLILRRMLAKRGLIPSSLAEALSAGADAVLLQQIGGSYRFVHALLQDFLAEEAEGRELASMRAATTATQIEERSGDSAMRR